MDIHAFFKKPDGPIKQHIQNNTKNLCNFELTEEQKAIIFSDSKNIMVNGVPGCGKTTTCVLRLVNKLLLKSPNPFNIMIITLVSSVTEEFVTRLIKYLPGIKLEKKNDSTRVTAEYNKNSIEISNYSAFIDSQLRYYQKNGGVLEYEAYGGKIKEETRSITIFGKDFSLKKKIYNYLAKQNKLPFTLKNEKPITGIILDEVQDYDQIDSVCFASIVKNNNIFLEGYGDILQSIFYKIITNKHTNGLSLTSINILTEKIENMKLLPLSTCFRCPYWHCEFLKIINKESNIKYNRKEIQSLYPKPEEQENKHKPMYFRHGKITQNVDAGDLAEILLIQIQTVRNYDKDIIEFVVQAPNVNTNKVFQKLEPLLKKNDIAAYYFMTNDGNGHTKTIDLDELKEDNCSKCRKRFAKKHQKCKNCGELRKRDKIALISGHGFKGGERTSVHNFGLSEYSCPKQNRPGTPNELADISLMGVMCSRSQKYLFLGGNHLPSRYITNNMEKLSNVMYLVQDFPKYLKKEATIFLEKGQRQLSKKIEQLNKYFEKRDIKKIKNLKMRKKKNLSKQDKKERNKLEFLKNLIINEIEKPEIYKKVSENIIEYNKANQNERFNSPLDTLLKKTETKLNTPDKNELSVSDIQDKTDDYEIISTIFNECVETVTTPFGKPINIEYKNLSAPPILGHLPNLIISFEFEYSFFRCLNRIIENDKIIYIDGSKHPGIFDILKDNFLYSNFLEGISQDDAINAIYGNRNYKNEKNKLKDKYVKILRNLGQDIFTQFGSSDTKYILLPSYFERVFYDRVLDTNKKTWNLCLMYDFIFNTSYTESSYMINNDSEYFTGDLSITRENVHNIIPNLKDIRIEIPCKQKIYIERNKEILKEELLFDEKKHSDIFEHGYLCSVCGRIDGYTHSYLYEFKMSSNEECKDSWKLQVLLYCYLGIEVKLRENHYELINFKDAGLYNFVSGKKTTFKIDLQAFKQDHAKKLFEEVLYKFNFKPKLKKNFLSKIT